MEGWSPGLGSGGNREMLVKGYQPSVIRWISSGDLMFRMATTVNNTDLEFAKRVGLKHSHNCHKKR